MSYYFGSADETAQYMQTALGQRKPTLVIRDVNVVDVYQGTIHEANVWVSNDRIVAVTRKDIECQSVFDGHGMYLAPSFMDAHMHIEPTMLLPSELARLLLRCGVTTIFADPHEIANVFGADGVSELVRLCSGVPLRIFLQVPSRVPTAEGLEDSGHSLDLKTIGRLLSMKSAASLGELNYQNLLSNPAKFIPEILVADALGRIVNGHLAGASAQEVNASAAVGLADDHECISPQEAVEKARRGIAVLVREGTPERNLRDILSNLKVSDLRSYLMCTDDKHPDDILSEGHVDLNVRLAIKSGVDPVTAIQMATINTAQHFRLDHLIGSVAPGRKADLLLFKGLEQIEIKATFFDGKIAYTDGKISFSHETRMPSPKFLDSIKISSEIKPTDLAIPHTGPSAQVHVIEVSEGQIVKGKGLANLPVQDGLILPEPSSDIVHVAVVERHKGMNSIGRAFVRGFSIKDGAISSSVSHDHHNITIVGDNVHDMYLALKELERVKGGFACASKGKVLYSIPLQFGGLISLDRYEVLLERLEKLNETAKSVGMRMKSPFMQLEFLSLPSVPELGITNRGLIDVRNWRIIDPVLS